MKRRILAVLLVLCCTVPLFAGCSPTVSPQSQAILGFTDALKNTQPENKEPAEKTEPEERPQPETEQELHIKHDPESPLTADYLAGSWRAFRCNTATYANAIDLAFSDTDAVRYELSDGTVSEGEYTLTDILWSYCGTYCLNGTSLILEIPELDKVTFDIVSRHGDVFVLCDEDGFAWEFYRLSHQAGMMGE